MSRQYWFNPLPQPPQARRQQDVTRDVITQWIGLIMAGHSIDEQGRFHPTPDKTPAWPSTAQLRASWVARCMGESVHQNSEILMNSVLEQPPILSQLRIGEDGLHEEWSMRSWRVISRVRRCDLNGQVREIIWNVELAGTTIPQLP